MKAHSGYAAAVAIAAMLADDAPIGSRVRPSFVKPGDIQPGTKGAENPRTKRRHKAQRLARQARRRGENRP